MEKTPYYLFKLREAFDSKQRKNPAYSLRAFAKQLNLQSPVMSEILRKKRHLPAKHAERIADILELSPAEKKKFLESLVQTKTTLRSLAKAPLKDLDFIVLDEERNFKIIAEWEHYAIFSLIDLPDFQADTKWISHRLGISEQRVMTVLDTLLEANLVKKDKRRGLVRIAEELNTTYDTPSSALRKSHRETLEMAAKAIDDVPVDLRYLSASTIAISMDRLNEAKDLFREFRERLCQLLENGKKTEVYQMGFQLFPLTKPNKDT